MFGQQQNKPPAPGDPNICQLNAFGQTQTAMSVQPNTFGMKVSQAGTNFGITQRSPQQGPASNTFGQMQQAQHTATFTGGSGLQQSQASREAFGDFGMNPVVNSSSQSLGLQGFPSVFGQTQQQQPPQNTMLTPTNGYQQSQPTSSQLAQLPALQYPMANGFAGSVDPMQSVAPAFNSFGIAYPAVAMSNPQSCGRLPRQTNPHSFAQVPQQQPEGTFSSSGQSQQMPQPFLSQQIPNSLQGSTGSQTMNPVFSGFVGGNTTGVMTSASSGTAARAAIFGQANTSSGPNLFGGAPLALNRSNVVGGPDGAFFIPVGTTLPFRPTATIDTMMKNGVNQPVHMLYQCISCMNEYESKSLEELRVEDYLANRKQGSRTVGGTFPMTSNRNFGASANQSPVNFGHQNSPVAGNFGQSAAAGVNSSTTALQSSVGSPAAAPTGFRPFATMNPSFGGFNTAVTQISIPVSKPLQPNSNLQQPVSTSLGTPTPGYRFGMNMLGASTAAQPLTASSVAPNPNLFGQSTARAASGVSASPFPMTPGLPGSPLINSRYGQFSPPPLQTIQSFAGPGSPASATFGLNSTQRK